MMDRDRRPLPPERVSWGAELVELREIILGAEASELPERPYAEESTSTVAKKP